MHDFDSGLRPELVRSESTRAEIKTELQTIFGYDFHGVANPSKMPYFEPCWVRFGGLCEHDDLCKHVAILTKNMYIRVRSEKGKFPILLEFGDF